MKNFVKTLAFLMMAIFSVFVLSGCGGSKQANSPEDIKKTGKIKIAVFSDKIPFGYVDKNGNNRGYDVYFARRIAKDLLGDEKKVEFVLVEAAARTEVLEADKVDLVLANFTVTKERAERVDFCLPYMKCMLGVVSKNGTIKNVSQLKGKKLIVNKGTTAEIYFTKNHPEIELLKYDQNTEAFQALKDGRGVALAHDNTEVFAWANRNAGYKCGIESLGSLDAIAPAVKKGNKSLQQWINDEIVNLAKEKFFHKAFDAELKQDFGAVAPDSVVVEGGKI
ncbi:MAG: cysteine ABC transporter substrate-binding protein [Phascolarctobacterium sp.]|nr:cysteine ABC transporter substrate-binding protein [Candidatus Phascolarctobacterium caballi]